MMSCLCSFLSSWKLSGEMSVFKGWQLQPTFLWQTCLHFGSSASDGSELHGVHFPLQMVWWVCIFCFLCAVLMIMKRCPQMWMQLIDHLCSLCFIPGLIGKLQISLVWRIIMRVDFSYGPQRKRRHLGSWLLQLTKWVNIVCLLVIFSNTLFSHNIFLLLRHITPDKKKGKFILMLAVEPQRHR